jgi:hypothetical protein
MPWRVIVFFLLTLGVAPASGAAPTLVSRLPALVLNVPPAPGEDSIRARLKACLAMGDLACVATQWSLLTGTDKVPKWLADFQHAFQAANQKAGKCTQVAQTVHQALQKLGERPEYLRITVTGEGRKFLGFDEIVNGVLVKTHQVATNGFHLVVRLNGRIIDAYTGRAGLPEEEYFRRLHPYLGMQLFTEVVESP